MKKNLLSIAGTLFVLCFSVTAFAQTAGSLTFKLTCPKHTTGIYETNARYVLAVWIESCTPCGTTAGTSTFVKTKVRYWGGSTNDHLPTWKAKSASSVVDATSGATTTNFASQTVTWNGTNVAGAVVADGSYRVCIQETWGHGTATVTRYIPFTKGPAVDNQTPAADTNFTGLTLTWQPTLATETFASHPEAVIYPNPSNGVFNIEYKNEVNTITVVNILGETVLTQKVDTQNFGTTQAIDLSGFNNGIYIVSLSNDKGTTSYKIVLNK